MVIYGPQHKYQRGNHGKNERVGKVVIEGQLDSIPIQKTRWLAKLI